MLNEHSFDAKLRRMLSISREWRPRVLRYSITEECAPGSDRDGARGSDQRHRTGRRAYAEINEHTEDSHVATTRIAHLAQEIARNCKESEFELLFC